MAGGGGYLPAEYLEIWERAYHVKIDATGASTATLVASSAIDTNQRLIVVAYTITVSGAVNLRFEDTDGTDLSGLLQFAAAGDGGSSPWNPHGHFACPAGKGLQLTFSAAETAGGHLTYLITNPTS